jgi:hypothetical protein
MLVNPREVEVMFVHIENIRSFVIGFVVQNA